MKIMAFYCDLRDSVYPLVEVAVLCGHIDPVFDPVCFFGVSESSQVFYIIRVILVCEEQTSVFKPFSQHTFSVQITKTKGTVNLGAVLLPCPLFYRFEKTA